MQIKAAVLLLTDPQYSVKITPDDLIVAIVNMLFTAEDEAKLFAATHKIRSGSLLHCVVSKAPKAAHSTGKGGVVSKSLL